MNCLACRRLLLAAPREQTPAQREHIAECSTCERLIADLATLEQRLADAALVPVPDALPERVLFHGRNRGPWKYAAAASIVLVAGAMLGLSALHEVISAPVRVSALSPAHPAVAAITMASNERLELPQSGDAARMETELKRVGLAFKDDAYAYYAGECTLPETKCDLILVSTPEAHAKLVLVPDYSIGERLVIDSGDKIALVSPAKTGTYIVVADTPTAAKHIESLIVKG